MKRKPYIAVYRKLLLWRVKIVGANGEPMVVSETYSSKSNALRAATNLADELKLKIEL